MKLITRFALLLAGVLAAPLAQADLYAARQAYGQQDFEKAFALYRELAELGEVRAQENVAAMYVAGEGVKRSNLLGYAWAIIALENGGGEGMRSIITQLDPYLSDAGRKRVDELEAQFGREALRKSLLPDIYANANYLDREPCRISKPETGIYPQSAVERGIQGNVYAEVTVMPDGRGRNPRVIYSVPAQIFDEAARAALLRTEFTPSRTKDGALVPCTMAMMFRYVLPGYESADYPKLEVLTRQTKEKADAGDPNAQLLYGYLISGLPPLRGTQGTGLAIQGGGRRPGRRAGDPG